MTIKETLLLDWNLMRILRVVGGFALIFAGITKHDTISGAFGLFFAYQGLFNVSCCGMGGCATSSCQTPSRNPIQETDDVEFEEVK